MLADPQAQIAGKRREELAEVRSHAAALRQMAEIIKKGREFTADDLFSLHTTLMQGAVVDIYKPVGQWKVKFNETAVKLKGIPTVNANYAAPGHVDRLMQTWLEELNRRMTSRSMALEDYVWLHVTFARIHPPSLMAMVGWRACSPMCRFTPKRRIRSSFPPPCTIAT